MKHCTFFMSIEKRYLACLLLVAVTGCASPKPVVVEVKEVKPVILSNEPSSELKAEFEAAMEVIKSEQFEKGIELLTSVASHSQQYAIPYLNLGLAYKKIGKLKEAEENLKLALNVAPENPVANNEYALLLRKTGRFTEARQRYEKILEKYPNFILAHKNLGILCDLYTKDYDCALKHYVFYSSVMQDDNTIKIWIADVQKRVRR